ncbi:MAG: hypothetical protein LQ344_006638 [Seirophora lacunosa]|nr:MAG: hypothetical protein LQ344_006638 [Seirophora lacunosa]
MRVLGPRGWNIRATAVTNQFAAVSVASSELLYGPAALFAKLALFLLYLRTFGPNKRFRYVTYAAISINVAFYTATTIQTGILCVRRSSETWLQSLASPRWQSNSVPLSYEHGVFGLISNIFIYCLPLPVVWQLQMPVRRKLAVSAIFATGLLAIVASALGLYYRIEIATEVDQFWVLPPILLVSIVEVCVEIICGSMPALASSFRHRRSKLNFSLPSSLKHLLLPYAGRSSRSGGKAKMEACERVESGPSDDNILVETRILQSIQQ